MNIDTDIEELLDIGRSGNFLAARELAGAGNHARVASTSYKIRGAVIDRISCFPIGQRINVTKAIAVYEDTVGGLGSVTALREVLPLFSDAVESGYQTIEWICANTRSLRHYASRAITLVEPTVANALHIAAAKEVERRNYELAAPARARRAERATSNLYNAVRRGDINAVRGLLQLGADPTSKAPTGETVSAYARSIGREDIAAILEPAGVGAVRTRDGAA